MKPDIEAKLQEKLKRKLIMLPEFTRDYILDLEFRRKQLRTRIEYAKDISLFFEFMLKEGLVRKEKVEDIVPADLDVLKPRDIGNFLSYLTSFEKKFTSQTGKQVVQRLTNSDSGKSRKVASLHEFFDYLVENDLITKDVTKKIDIKVERNISIKNRLTRDDMKDLFAAIMDDENIENSRMAAFHQKTKFRDYIIVLMLSYTGIRVSELVQLDIDEISIDERVMVVVRKGGRQERVTLPSRIIKDVSKFINERRKTDYPTKALFVSLHKKRINPKTIRAMLDKYRIRAGIDMKVTPHVFRRTFGTEHYNRYRDMYLTAQIMGHRSAETTRKFYADPAEVRRVKSMQEFEYTSNDQDATSLSVSTDKLRELARKMGTSIEELLK